MSNEGIRTKSTIVTKSSCNKWKVMYNNKKGEKSMENTKYNEEFKQSIVSLYNSGKSSTQICKEYGMSSSTLHKWIKKYTQVKVSDTETMTMAEIKKMQKKLALLEEENIILKKAMAIFIKESGKESD